MSVRTVNPWKGAAAALLALLGLSSATLVLAGEPTPVLASIGRVGAAKKPRLGLRASPRIAFSPVDVLVVAELVGGDEHEDYYCPGLEWDWGDGNRSAQESDCEPFGPDSALERRFTARHAYYSAGNYNVRLTLRRANRTVAVATVPVRVHGASSSSDDE